jgi:hypothetical protein
MTNLLFQLIVSLATNTTETLQYPQIPGPCPDLSFGPNLRCAAMHWQDDKSAGPSGKIIRTTISRVTNAVEIARDGVYVKPTDPTMPRVLELGRCELSNDVQWFTAAVERKWLPLQHPNIPMWFMATNGFQSRLGVVTNITVEWLTNAPAQVR